MSNILNANGSVTVTLTSTQKLAVYTKGSAIVYRTIGYPKYPDQSSKLGTVSNTTTTFGTYTGGATIVIENTQSYPVIYDVGTAPVVTDNMDKAYQAAPATATATATLASADLLSSLIVATPAAAATYTLPTGALLDASATMSIGDSFGWSIINLATNATFIITVAAGTGHTVVGVMDVASNNATTGALYGASGHFKTRKTAADTFVTYRVA
jgi:hypothetical protein